MRFVLRESTVAGLDGTANPEDELREHVRSLVGLLDPLDQEIVTLVYWEGFSRDCTVNGVTPIKEEHDEYAA